MQRSPREAAHIPPSTTVAAHASSGVAGFAMIGQFAGSGNMQRSHVQKPAVHVQVLRPTSETPHGRSAQMLASGAHVVVVPRIPVQPTGVAIAAHIPVLPVPAVAMEPAAGLPAVDAPAEGAPPAPVPALVPPAPVPAVVLVPAPATGLSSPSALEQLADATATRIDVTRSETPPRSFGVIVLPVAKSVVTRNAPACGLSSNPAGSELHVDRTDAESAQNSRRRTIAITTRPCPICRNQAYYSKRATESQRNPGHQCRNGVDPGSSVERANS